MAEETKKVDIKIRDLSKIEGHADLDVKVRGGKVTSVKIQFNDNKRFFTKAIIGKEITSLPQSTSRICGTCSVSHLLCCIKAIETALDMKVSEQTMKLRKLTNYGLYIRDHALHIYLFSLPDVFNKDSVLDFKKPEEIQLLKDSFDIKRAGNKLTQVVAGRAVHAPYPQVGGYAQTPKNEDLKALLPELAVARKKVMKAIKLYAEKKVNYERSTNFVALKAPEFNFLEGDITGTDGTHVKPEGYYDHLEKTVLPYSQAVGYKFGGGTYMVGALARLNITKENLHEKTKKTCSKYLKMFPSTNIFHNNLAQAIEIMHAIDHTEQIINETTFTEEKPLPIKPKDCKGVGVIEAPRGLLYYQLSLGADGTVKDGKIITPTQQNQINIEQDIQTLVQKKIGKMRKEKISYEIEKLIRSYDPCISCATHFLKINWDEE